ncbi:MAG: hypothetical protein ACFFD4_02405 [Candidatus Odinarchaeota archaeon]
MVSRLEILDHFVECGGHATLSSLYSHFKARKKNQKVAIRKHVSRLRNDGKIVKTVARQISRFTKDGNIKRTVERGAYSLANELGTQVEPTGKADELTYFSDTDKIRAHGLKITYKKPPAHQNIYGQVVSEGWEVNDKGHFASKTITYGNQCDLRFQVFTNGTIQIHTNFKVKWNKGFTYPEYLQFLDYLQDWGKQYGLNVIEKFKLYSWDINQDRENIVNHDRAEVNIKVFSDIFLRIYTPEGVKNGTRFEIKAKRNEQSAKGLHSINEALKNADPGLTSLVEDQLVKLAQDQKAKHVLAGMNQSFVDETKKTRQHQKTLAEMFNYSDLKIDTLIKSHGELEKKIESYTPVSYDTGQVAIVTQKLESITDQFHQALEAMVINSDQGLQTARRFEHVTDQFQEIISKLTIKVDKKDEEIQKLQKKIIELENKVLQPPAPQKVLSPSLPVKVTNVKTIALPGKLTGQQLKVFSIVKNAGKPLLLKDFQKVTSIRKDSLRKRLLDLTRMNLVLKNQNGSYELRS